MLKPSEREKLQDCLMLLQSVRNILNGMRQNFLPDITSVEKCCTDADKTLTRLLRT
jgi:hypothetical protein